MSAKAVDKLTSAEAEKELDRLAKEIAEHDRAIMARTRRKSAMPDYDALRRRNAEIEERVSRCWCGPTVPSHRVGAKASEKFAKVTHRVPMLSLDNAFSDEDVADFLGPGAPFPGLKEEDEDRRDGRAQDRRAVRLAAL
jgi:DNA ligase (NAD+)